ncbi:expressed unknown protein [Seminavis robusta]|uniref:Uncharacterized protein n=1 Tax=Seminavis robusta TaxID=568900 RepID=A0A9N8EFM4_9STRA|nr:expressed unknown protein [Seminavis robusta]|eukprot:Sro1083_g239380.1 n/a (536) ;mRNA; f:21840-23447
MLSLRCCSFLLSAFAIVFTRAEPSQTVACRSNPEEMDRFYQKYHDPRLCERLGGSSFAEEIKHDRQVSFERLRHTKTHPKVPDQQTVVCPTNVQPLALPGQAMGMKTVWMVQNTASVPVVLSWVAPDTLREFSAMDASIAPPQADPNAIVPPGSGAILYGYEGHVFYARELLADGSAGNVLIQHRLGWIPVGAAAQNLTCSTITPPPKKTRKLALPPTPKVTPPKAASLSAIAANKAQNILATVSWWASAAVAVPTGMVAAGYDYWNNVEEEEEPEEAVIADPEPKPQDDTKVREVAESRERQECNTVEVVFRNRSPCPVNAYWVNPHNQCEEVFKFHLGMEASVDNFMWDWKSPTKGESTFMGHQYVFRCSANNNQVVDSVYLQPTRIVDCPRDKQQQQQQPTIPTSDVETARQVKLVQDDAQSEASNSMKNYSRQQQAVEQVLMNTIEICNKGTAGGECMIPANISQFFLPSDSQEQPKANPEPESTKADESIAEELHQEYQHFLKKLEGNPERMQRFLDYMKTHGSQYEQEN